MTTQVANIIFNDSASRFNRDLIDFLKRNLDPAIKRGRISFNFKIAETNELPQLRQQGIKRLPAMILNNKPFIGVPDIIAEIRRVVKTSKSMAPPRSEDEVIRDYQLSVIGPVSKDAEGKLVVHDDDDEAKTDDLQSKIQAEMRRRGIQNEEENKPGNRLRPPPQPKQPDRMAQRDDEDDDEEETAAQNRRKRQNTRPQQPQQQQREDNLAAPHMADAFASLNRVARSATAEDRKDDDMMATLLAKMGGD